MKLPSLPVLECLSALRAALTGAGAAVLAAPPGSGKTTLIPLTLLDEPWLRGRNILILEPRRIAARAAAARMASLLGETVGQRVGYQIRFERRIGPATRIEVITEGLLTRRLQSDPELPGVGLVIFDEFHERSLDADLALALTLDARATLNPDLRVLVMSATLDTRAVASLLGGAPVVQSAGRSFPVEIRYHPPATDEGTGSAVAQGVQRALAETRGDILAFLPGGREIRDAQRRLASRIEGSVDLLPLYGDMDSVAQDRVLAPAPQGRRKVILATNIAQTSLTIEGVTAVVDGGYARVARFDRGSGANGLETQRISRAAADQRAGRAGRLGPGVAYRLWTAEQQGRLAAQDTPEILVADLTRLALELVQWGIGDPSTLHWLDPPPPGAWTAAMALLAQLDALDASGRPTPHGRELARLPAAPRRGHMLLLARQQGLGALAAGVAALLEERDGRFDSADLALRLQSLRSSDGGGRGGFDAGARRRIRESARQLQRLVEVADDDIEDVDVAGRVVAWAYPERIARRRAGQGPAEKEIRYQCADGGEASLRAQDPLSRSEWLAIAHWEPGSPRRIHLAGVLSADEIERDHAGHIRWHSECRWDVQTESVIAEEQRRLGSLVLARRDPRSAGGEAVRAAMLEGLRALGLAALPWDESSRQWQARVLSLRAWRPGEDCSNEDWPDVGDTALIASLENWLAPYLEGIRRREHLQRLDLAGILNRLLDYRQQQALARLAPTHLLVPSGSRIALAYDPPGPPVLAVKLQELFGLSDTPRVNDGRTPVSLHLLSPARRPIQVTQDLAGFWARTYPEVKKELKGRYPKHPWPDDPYAAQPTARAKPRGR